MSDMRFGVKDTYLITGSCRPETNASARLEHADYLDEIGDSATAEEYRAIVARMIVEWNDPREHVKAKLGLGHFLMDPDEVVPPLGSPEHPMFWHEPKGAPMPVCACGHFADFLCDEPVGDGRTCDIPACECCRNAVAPGIDQCDFHRRTKPREARA